MVIALVEESIDMDIHKFTNIFSDFMNIHTPDIVIREKQWISGWKNIGMLFMEIHSCGCPYSYRYPE